MNPPPGEDDGKRCNARISSLETKVASELNRIEMMFKERGSQYDERFRTQQEALKVATDAMNKRLDGMNEFRGALLDQSKQTMPREEYNRAHSAVLDRLNIVESDVKAARAKGEGISMISGVIYSLVIAVGSAVGVWIALRGR